MQTLTLPAFKPADFDGNSQFNVVIAYEDFETGKRAMKTYEYLLENLGHECRFNNQMWKFDVLSVSKLRDMAARDAATADLVIVSAHGANELPADVKKWIELWLLERKNTIALVGLFDPGAGENPVLSYLTNVAQSGQIEFFSQPGLWPGRAQGTSEEWERNDRTFSVIADVVQRESSLSHWGINE
jgi:hypothetical protein